MKWNSDSFSEVYFLIPAEFSFMQCVVSALGGVGLSIVLGRACSAWVLLACGVCFYLLSVCVEPKILIFVRSCFYCRYSCPY